MSKRSAMKLAAVGAAATVMLLAQRLGLFHAFSDPAQVKQTLLVLGPWGYVAFVVAYATLQPFGVPGTIFVFAAPLIWVWPVAFALSMAGTMAASVVGFSFARFVARDWMAPRIPARFRADDEALARRAFSTVFVLRLVFWMPPLLHAFFGLSKVPFATHFWASLAGYSIPLFLISLYGERLFAAARSAPVWFWITVAVSLIVVGGLAHRRRRRTSH